jgi:perosamine synthetase
MKIGRMVPPAAAPLAWADLRRAIAGAFRSDRSVHAFEKEIRRHFGARHVFLVSSGTAALTLALRALRSLSGRSEVVLPAYTCFSVPAAVLTAGLTPRPCDIDASNFDFDRTLLGETLTPNTLCVITHHLFGIPSDVARTQALCRQHGVFVVEDAAQAMGAESKGRLLGTLGDVGIFSLDRGKNITCGSGGIILTNSDEIAAALARHYQDVPKPALSESIREFFATIMMAIFIRPRLYWIPAALPFLRLGETIFPRHIPVRRLSGVKAGMLRNWQQRLIEANRGRAESAAYFTRRLPLGRAPEPHPYLRLPLLAASHEEKRRLHSLSTARGLGLGVGYPSPIDEIPEVRSRVNGKRFPSARRVADGLVTIPTHHWLSERDRRAIATLCREVRLSCSQN